jgi:hypothetical protein
MDRKISVTVSGIASFADYFPVASRRRRIAHKEKPMRIIPAHPAMTAGHRP